jgi:hypothetical protein
VCPSTGTATVKPRRKGSAPIASSAATINPHSAMVNGLAATTRIDVSKATAAPTLRSSSSAKDTTLIASAAEANRKPTQVPTTIRYSPARVANTSWTKRPIDAGGE